MVRRYDVARALGGLRSDPKTETASISSTFNRCTETYRSRRHVGAPLSPVIILQKPVVSDLSLHHAVPASCFPGANESAQSTSARVRLENINVLPSQQHSVVAMAESQPKQWGVTAPISTQQPNQTDLKLNDELVEELKRRNVFESPEGSDMRYERCRVLVGWSADPLQATSLEALAGSRRQVLRPRWQAERPAPVDYRYHERKALLLWQLCTWCSRTQ